LRQENPFAELELGDSVADTVGTLLEQGMNPVPVYRPGEPGAKRPRQAWKQLQTIRLSPISAQKLFRLDPVTGRAPGVAVICGAVSGGLEMVELEGRSAQMMTQVRQAAQTKDCGSLMDRLEHGWVERSYSGGIHFFLQSTTGIVPGNTRLACTKDNLVLAETRGEGGYTVIAPTRGIDPGDSGWSLLRGGPASCPKFTPAEISALHECFTVLDQRERVSEPTRRVVKRMEARPDGQERPGDVFNRSVDWADVLEPHGWRCVGQDGGGQRFWCRPGKQFGVSASTGYGQGDYLYVFSTSTMFEPEKAYSKFSAYTLLNHGGNYQAAARAIRQSFPYGDPPAGESHIPQPIEEPEMEGIGL